MEVDFIFNSVGEIQENILSATGLKTSVKRGTGSMKGYLIISPMFQSGQYPDFPFEYVQNLKSRLPGDHFHPPFANTSQICIFNIEDNRQDFKKENKPKGRGEGASKGWGSKNSQLRLDKASARYSKKLNKGSCARYY